jgi:hypothetical protein
LQEKAVIDCSEREYRVKRNNGHVCREKRVRDTKRKYCLVCLGNYRENSRPGEEHVSNRILLGAVL